MRKFHCTYCFIAQLFDALKFAYRAFKFWMSSDKDDVTYFTFSKYGIPVASCILAKGREAWRVANMAIEACQWRRKS